MQRNPCNILGCVYIRYFDEIKSCALELNVYSHLNEEEKKHNFGCNMKCITHMLHHRHTEFTMLQSFYIQEILFLKILLPFHHKLQHFHFFDNYFLVINNEKCSLPNTG